GDSGSGLFVGGLVVPLSNGNYVVDSDFWNAGFGAVTWGNGSTGVGGTVSEANSLVGNHPDDDVGGGGGIPFGIALLSDGNYLIASPGWNDGRGAVTWGNGTTGVSGFISDANSLVGTNPGELVGLGEGPYGLPAPSVKLLTDGNYVV